MKAMTVAIETRDLHVSYGEHHALCDTTFSVPTGASLAIIGPNGSGKSTLLNALAGVVKPVSGSVSVTGPSPAFVLQATEVDKSLPITVRDTITMARYPRVGTFGRLTQIDRDAVSSAMERLHISDLASKQLHDLSGGQRQRVLVAQGLAQEAEVLLLDEPMTGLDVTSYDTILEIVDQEVARGCAVAITTHSLDDARRCDYVLLLDTRPVAFGTADEVLIEEHLRTAFGGNFVKVGDQLILDDPHHHHDH